VAPGRYVFQADGAKERVRLPLVIH
jgi:hypothetical protein